MAILDGPNGQGLDADFVCADVYDAVQATGQRRFEIVYTGLRALVWLPDIDRWAGVVAWLVDEDDQIGERADVAESLDISVLSAGLLCVVSVLVVPGTAALFAVFTLLRRRFL